MYQILSLLTGVTLAVMVAINGNLTAAYGVFPATVIIHMVGSLFAFVASNAQKENVPLLGHHPWWVYLGGAIGVLTTLFNNLAYGKISMTSIVALGLLGQTITALFIDRFGLLGMERRPFKKSSLWCLGFAILGIAVMLDDSVTAAAAATAVSIGAGVSVVLSRTVNARLAVYVGALRGSLVNHLVGLPISILLAVYVLNGEPLSVQTADIQHLWIYVGGILGVAVVLLCNLTVPKVPAMRLTVLTFVGQVFTGILLDLFSGNSYSDASFSGGLIISIGIAASMLAAKPKRRKPNASAQKR